MKHVKISVLIPGMVTAEDVFSRSMQLILPKGLVLTDKAILRLESYDIQSVRIEDPVGIEVEEIEEDVEEEVSPAEEPLKLSDVDSDNIDLNLLNDGSASDILSALANLNGDNPTDNIDVSKNEEANSQFRQITAMKGFENDISVKDIEEPSHFDKIQSSPEFKKFKMNFTKNVEEFKTQLNDIVEKNAPIEVDRMLDSTMNLLSEQNNSFGVFDMLHNMRQFDDLTYAHSMNVALICNVFAQWLNLTPEEVKLATACGMLHDIGKLKIDDAIIKKPGKLTDQEYKMIKAHPVEGYKILQHQVINEHIKNSALMHHEKCDGSGYPLKLTGDKIDAYAKLVAIADVYDAMTSARVYRGALCPFKVIEMFEQEGLHKYDIVFIMTFLENVINTYIDNRVLLSDGRIGTVKWIDKQNLSKPMVQLQDQSFLELSKYKDLSIERIL